MSERCGSEDTTTGQPCRFPSEDNCPHHPHGGKRDSPAGPKTTYDRDTANEVCRRMACGETLRGICRDEDMPPESTVRGWVIDDRENFAAQYARARRLQVDHWADEIVAVADDGAGDTWVDEDGNERVNHDVIRRSELRVDTRKWLMSKLKPGTYGDRSKVELMGEDGGPVEHSIDRPLSREEKAAAVEELLEQARAREGAAKGNGANP